MKSHFLSTGLGSLALALVVHAALGFLGSIPAQAGDRVVLCEEWTATW
jgi:hypothetical protein